jgi:pimeloyl-ACP methyl ester carboxylesterase
MHALEKEGLTLAYEDCGMGPPILFVHGCSCDHSMFDAQFTHFRRRHRVVNMDLRGHGESSVPRLGYAPTDLADDIAFLSRELCLYKPVLVGHGVGGLAALALAARYPYLPSAIVMLDTAVFLPPRAAAELGPIFEAIIAPGGMGAWIQWVKAGLGAAMGPEAKARILALVQRTPHAIVAQAIAGMLGLDAAGAASAVRVPILHVRSFAPLDEAAFRKACPLLKTEEVQGAGHFLMLDAPDRVNAILEGFLDTVMDVFRDASRRRRA